MNGEWDKYLELLDKQKPQRAPHKWDASAADAALMSIVNHYTKNFAQCEAIWAMSPLADMEQRYKSLPIDKRAEKMKAQRNRFAKGDKVMRAILFAAKMNHREETQRAKTLEHIKATAESLKAQRLMEVQHKLSNIEDIPDALTYPPGFMGDLAKYFFKQSGRPIKEFAIASAIGLVAGIAGISYNFQNPAIGLNQYMIVLAPSGIGKSFIIDLPDRLLRLLQRMARENGWTELFDCTNYLSRTAFTHENSLLNTLSENPCFMWASDEFGVDFMQMADQRSGNAKATVTGAITNLFGRSAAGQSVKGVSYSDKSKTVFINHPVGLTMLAESTPETVFENISLDMFENGFLSRCLFLNYDGKKPYANSMFDPNHVPDVVINHLGALIARAEDHKRRIMGEESWKAVPTFVGCEPEVTQRFDAFSRDCDDKYNNTKVHEAWKRALLTRFPEKVLRLATLLAVADCPEAPSITLTHFMWAHSFVQQNNHMLTKAIDDGRIATTTGTLAGVRIIENFLEGVLSGKETSPLPESKQDTERYNKGIQNNPPFITYDHLARKLKVRAPFYKHEKPTVLIKESLQHLVDAGTLVKMSREDTAKLTGKTGVTYFIIK